MSESTPVGYNELNELILLCENIAENNYCKTSYQNYLQALNQAKSMVNAKTADNQSEVESMVNTLNHAIKNLIEKGDYINLISIINLAEKINRNFYIADSLAVLDELIAEIKNNYSDYDEQTVSEKEKALNDAILNLVPNPDYEPDSSGNSSLPNNSSTDGSASSQNSSQGNGSTLSSSQSKGNDKSGCSARLGGQSIALLTILAIITLIVIAKRNKHN